VTDNKHLLLLLLCKDEFSRHSMTCLTRSVAGSSTVLDQNHSDRSTSLDQVDLRWSSDVDLVAHRDRGFASDVAAHQADTRYAAQLHFTIALHNSYTSETRGNYYSVTSNNMKLVHWPLIGGLLHLVQRGGDWAGPQPAQAPPRFTKCNSPPINGHWTNHRIILHNGPLICGFNVGIKALRNLVKCDDDDYKIRFTVIDEWQRRR